MVLRQIYGAGGSSDKFCLLSAAAAAGQETLGASDEPRRSTSEDTDGLLLMHLGGGVNLA